MFSLGFGARLRPWRRRNPSQRLRMGPKSIFGRPKVSLMPKVESSAPTSHQGTGEAWAARHRQSSLPMRSASSHVCHTWTTCPSLHRSSFFLRCAKPPYETRPLLARKHHSPVTILRKLLCASCSAQVALSKLLCANCSVQAALRKLLCASCSAQVALCKLLPASCSVQAALCSCSAQVALR